MGVSGWRAAMGAALYGPGGFFTGSGAGPAGHFRTSVHASPLFAGALLRLIERVDAALGHPDPFDVVDVGAGRGELLTALRALLPLPGASDAAPGAAGSAGRGAAGGDGASSGSVGGGSAVVAAGAGPGLAGRVRFVGVEVGARPDGLDLRIGWRREVPAEIVGMLVATEWLDNVPLDLAEIDEYGRVRRVLVDTTTGTESLGPVVDAADLFWLARWWPASIGPPSPTDFGYEVGRLGGTRSWTGPGARFEVGWPRDVAWADAVSSVRRGGALAVDYGHLRGNRPGLGTLTGFRGGRQVVPVPDGTRDLTAHVAMDAAGGAAGAPYRIVGQREALRALGVDGGRPPLDLARTDPAAYLRALAGAGAAAELTDPDGLGGHWWLLHTIGIKPILD